MHLVVLYREPDDDVTEFVDNTGGDFAPAGEIDHGDAASDDGELHFGFAPVKRG